MSMLSKEDYVTLYTKDAVQSPNLLAWEWTLPQSFVNPMRVNGAWVSLIEHSPLLDSTSLPPATITSYIIEYGGGGSNNYSTNNTGSVLGLVSTGSGILNGADSPKVFVSSNPTTIKLNLRLPTTGAIPVATGGGGDQAASVFVLKFEYIGQEFASQAVLSTLTPTI